MEIGQLGETGVNVAWHAEEELESAIELVQTRRLKMEDLIARVTAKKKKYATTILAQVSHNFSRPKCNFFVSATVTLVQRNGRGRLWNNPEAEPQNSGYNLIRWFGS